MKLLLDADGLSGGLLLATKALKRLKLHGEGASQFARYCRRFGVVIKFDSAGGDFHLQQVKAGREAARESAGKKTIAVEPAPRSPSRMHVRPASY